MSIEDVDSQGELGLEGGTALVAGHHGERHLGRNRVERRGNRQYPG